MFFYSFNTGPNPDKWIQRSDTATLPFQNGPCYKSLWGLFQVLTAHKNSPTTVPSPTQNFPFLFKRHILSLPIFPSFTCHCCFLTVLRQGQLQSCSCLLPRCHIGAGLGWVPSPCTCSLGTRPTIPLIAPVAVPRTASNLVLDWILTLVITATTIITPLFMHLGQYLRSASNMSFQF